MSGTSGLGAAAARLSRDELATVRTAAAYGDVLGGDDKRRALLEGISPRVVATIPLSPKPLNQADADLTALEQVPGGLEQWVENALRRTEAPDVRSTFEAALGKLRGGSNAVQFPR